MSSTSMRRRAFRWLAFAVVLGVAATAAPPAAQAAARIGYKHEDMFYYDSMGQPHFAGSMQMVVYSDQRKELKVCDQMIDPFMAIVEIDPTGGGTPDTLMYPDQNYAEPGCSNYTFWYPVRKWRTMFQHIGNGEYMHIGDWGVEPLPYHDF